MNPQTRKHIIVIALDNLISDYQNALEDKELNLNQEEREFAINMISNTREILSEEIQEVDNPVTPRPQWKKT